MSTQISTTPPIVSFADVHLFSVKAFIGMIDGGSLDGNERVELVNGVICDMTPTNPEHNFSASVLDRILQRAVVEGYSVRPQATLELSDSLLEPDLLVLVGNDLQFARVNPRGADCLLVIEVSNSSLRKDREDKLPIYAAAGIPEYWIVNLLDHCIEVYTEPNASQRKYARQTSVRRDGSLTLGEFAGNITIQVADILPPLQSKE